MHDVRHLLVRLRHSLKELAARAREDAVERLVALREGVRVEHLLRPEHCVRLAAARLAVA